LTRSGTLLCAGLYVTAAVIEQQEEDKDEDKDNPIEE
jgi:hypothetical protein